MNRIRQGKKPTLQDRQLLQDELRHSSTPSHEELLEAVIESINLAHDSTPGHLRASDH
jgi:hypothetical protein